jgi:hypothetical protein
MKSNMPIEVVLRTSLRQDEMIDCSFSRIFEVGDQSYVALNREEKVFLLKVIDKNGKQLLQNIESQHEFDSVLEVYNRGDQL